MDQPTIEQRDGSVTITGHRWRVEVITDAGQYIPDPAARGVYVTVFGSGGGDASDGTPGEPGTAGFNPVPTDGRRYAVTIDVAPGGPPGTEPDGTTAGRRGHDGFAVVHTVW